MEKPNVTSIVWAYVIATVMALTSLGIGISLLSKPDLTIGAELAGSALVTGGVVGCLAILIAAPLAMHFLNARRQQLEHQQELLGSVNERLQGISVLLQLVSEQQLLSDRAKRIAFRQNDHEAVVRGVREEMSKQNWDAALVLAESIESEFGYKQQSDDLISEINKQRDEQYRKQLADLLAPIDRYIQAEAWGAAIQEAHKLMSQHPADAQIARLPEEIENRRQALKTQLRQSWQEAIDRHDVDGSIEILKKLDLYLTPAEAESLQNIARTVFKEKRDALRTQFVMAVQEKKWALAVRLGDEIMSEFPNTRIAQEVREKIDVLRTRAENPEAAIAG